VLKKKREKNARAQAAKRRKHLQFDPEAEDCRRKRASVSVD
jgi:hypothetical protein